MSQTNFEQTWRKRFERFAAFENDAKIAGWSEHSLQTRVSVFKQNWTRKEAGLQWIDVGCGAGTYTQVLLEQEQQVVALDYSQPTIKKAKNKVSVGASFGAADVRHLPFQPETIYGVLCFGVLQALEQPIQAINEIDRVLQPGGELWVDALNRGSLRFCFEWLKHKITGQPYRLTFVSASKLRQYLKNKSYQDIRIIWMPILPEKYHMLQNKLFSYIQRFDGKLNFLWMLVSHAYVIKAKKSEG
tara:strand:- start:25879 stop:26610 length:732 start_codon:yes stop_codon:yes gene_type:complete